MQVEQKAQPLLEVLRDANSDAAEAFSRLRQSVERGPLDPTTVELILVGALAATGQVESLAVHVRRALKRDVPAASLRHAVIATLGAGGVFNDIVIALREINEVTAALTAAS
jgi:alkylhydroperoxidase/carboxymuconolactone decarboxylase family protein YurZ